MKRRRILSGMRPTGPLHLGHLTGALENWVRAAVESTSASSASWTGTRSRRTTPTPADLARNVLEMATDWLAVGLDPRALDALRPEPRCREHAELHLLLSMIIPVPWLERVPTYKEQQQQLDDKDLSTYGFLGYPVLQTADIVVYKADAVPVGEDQAAARRADARGRAALQQPLRRRLPRAPDAARRRRAARPAPTAQDVEVVRQRDLPQGPARGGAREAEADEDRPRSASAAATRASPTTVRCSTCTRPSAPGDARMGRAGLPQRRHRLHRLQAEALGARHRAHGRDPRARPEFERRPDAVWDILHEGSRAKAAAEATMDEVRAAVKIKYR